MRQMHFFGGRQMVKSMKDMHFGKCEADVATEGSGSRRRLPTLEMEHANLRCGFAEEQLRTYYRTLFRTWGRQHWWPADTRFEVIAGAYLTQNTAWTNVERALASLRAAGLLNLEGIRRVALPELERLIRSAGYFRQKARRLKKFVAFLDERYRGSLQRMFSRPTEELRQELLALDGIGPETADSILLYAGNHAVFVVDAYTRRILHRHGITAEKASYEEIRELVERALAPLAVETGLADARERQSRGKKHALQGVAHPPSAMSKARRSALTQVYNEMHGLIVGVGKHYCKKAKAECEECPLQPFLSER